MIGVKNFSCIGRGGIIWDRGDNFRQFIDWGSYQGASHQGDWTGYLQALSVVLSGSGKLKETFL